MKRLALALKATRSLESLLKRRGGEAVLLHCEGRYSFFFFFFERIVQREKHNSGLQGEVVTIQLADLVNSTLDL